MITSLIAITSFTLLIGYNMPHILSCLIYLELLVLLNYWLFMGLISSQGVEASWVMGYFVITVASAALGLSVLVGVCRTHGQDYLYSYNLIS